MSLKLCFAAMALAIAIAEEVPVVKCAVDISVDLCNKAVHFHNLGGELLARGDSRAAIVAYEAALDVFAFGHTYLSLASVYISNGDSDKGSYYFQRCVDDPNTDNALKSAALNNYAHFVSTSNRMDYATQDIAISYYKRAHELHPTSIDPLYNWALSLELQGRWLEALQGFSRTLEVDPDHCSSMLGVGNSLFQFGQLEEAIEWFKYVGCMATSWLWRCAVINHMLACFQGYAEF